MYAKAIASKPQSYEIKHGEIQEDLRKWNDDCQYFLGQDERVVFRPFLVFKTKPDQNGLFCFFSSHWRYLMFTNKKLYNIDPEALHSGALKDSPKFKNEIDITDRLSHIIFFPTSDDQVLERLDPSKVTAQDAVRFEGEKVDIILGFRPTRDFKEGDISINFGDMLTLLKLIHSCFLVQVDQRNHDVTRS